MAPSFRLLAESAFGQEFQPYPNDVFLYITRSIVFIRKESTPNQVAVLIKRLLSFILYPHNLLISLFKRYRHIHGRLSSCGCAFENLLDGMFCMHCYL